MCNQDWRNVRNGDLILSDNYSDQPYVVKTDDGAWLLVVTTGSGREGHPGQHVISARSFDCGKTWIDVTDVESAKNPESSYAVLYKTAYGRIYCFYNYNAENRRYVLSDPGLYDNGKCSRVDSQGSFVFKYSDDNGKSWSRQWYEIPQRKFRVDLENPYGGDVLYFWNVGKPFSYKNGVFVPIYKIGGLNAQFMYKTEGALLYCDNIHSERNPELLHWNTYPEGDTGIRVSREISEVSEEHSFVVLSDGSIFCVFRTISGHAYCTYSRDGGRSFTEPERMKYANGRDMKHPRAANFIWKCENGKYLYWYHNNGGYSYDGRNPVWIAGAVEYTAQDGQRLKFSQPEILLYDEDVFIRMSYPDMVEQDGEYYFTETQKCAARTHLANRELIEGLWEQLESENKISSGRVLKNGDPMPVLRNFIKESETEGDKRAIDLLEGFTIAMEADLPSAKDTIELCSTQTPNREGIHITWNGCELIFTMGDGRRVMQFAADRELLAGGGLHKIVITVDAGPRIVSILIDGNLCDGGRESRYGYHWFDRYMIGVNGDSHINVTSAVKRLEIYEQMLTTSEAVRW